MTCTHVLGLIDAGPFADYPRAHLDAAWQHARQCPRCGPALEAAIRLTTELHGLAQPAPPPDLARVVMARIARVEERPTSVSPALPEARARLSVADWSVRAAAVGGLAAAAAIVTSMPAGELPIYMASPAVGGLRDSLAVLRPSGAEAAVLAAGLMLYLGALFAPLRHKNR